MLSIGALSAQTGVKVPTIRYYEQIGLLAPARRSAGNQRRYDGDAARRLSFIRHARALGFSLEDITALLALSDQPENSCHDAHVIVENQLRAVQARMKKLKKLEKELKRIGEAGAHDSEKCHLIETLADHRLCSSAH